MSNDDKGNYMLGVIMAHYSLKLGLKKIFIKGVKDVTDELSQLHYMKNFFPVDPKTITKEERTNEITYLMLLKEKPDGRAKGRSCVNASKQHTHTNK